MSPADSAPASSLVTGQSCSQAAPAGSPASPSGLPYTVPLAADKTAEQTNGKSTIIIDSSIVAEVDIDDDRVSNHAVVPDSAGAGTPAINGSSSNINSQKTSIDEATDLAARAAAAAEAHKSNGNQLFKERLYDAACQAYSKAIEICESMWPTADSSADSDALGCQQQQIHIYLCNRAFCHFKLENFGSAILDADSAIEKVPSYSKAYYRRGAAYAALMKFQLALKDFKTSDSLQPNAETRMRIKECQAEIRKQKFANAIASDRSKSVSETIDLSTLESGLNSYTGPKYRREAAFLPELIEFLKMPGNILHKRYAYQIVLDIIEELKKLPSLVEIEVGRDEEFTVCGDVHGQFFDLDNIFRMNGLPSETNPYLFNGDFVDRGSFSVECILTLFAAKAIFPAYVHLGRGNHETKNMNELYGFKGEVVSKYDHTLYTLFSESFCWLPLAHTINKKVFVVHGGLSSSDSVTLEEISKLNRVIEPPDGGLMTELLWSDPQLLNGRSPSKRGVACSFGPDVTESFLTLNKLSYIIRSHEMKDEGYDVQHNGKLITVFSAPNYCDQMRNKGAFIRMKGDLKPNFTSFEAVTHPPVSPMKYANPLVHMI